MNRKGLERIGKAAWRINPTGMMRAPVILFATETLLDQMDEKVFEQAINVAALPGIVQASYVMPDAHWGYGFPIGGVAAFDPDEGGVISAGGVGLIFLAACACSPRNCPQTKCARAKTRLPKRFTVMCQPGLAHVERSV